MKVVGAGAFAAPHRVAFDSAIVGSDYLHPYLHVLGDAMVRRLMAVPALGHKQRHTLRSILELGIQALGFLLILFVIFGAPQQMPTILGLATAGITIVLQDFILAFFGWFVSWARTASVWETWLRSTA